MYANGCEQIQEIRSLQPEDLEKVKNLYLQCFPVEYPDKWYHDITQNAKYYTRVAITPSGYLAAMILAEEKVLLRCHPEDADILASWFPQDSRVVYIMSVGVDRLYRRLGMGRYLIQQLLYSLGVKDSLVISFDNNSIVTMRSSFNNCQNNEIPSILSILAQENSLNLSSTIDQQPGGGGGGGGLHRLPNEQCKAVYLHVLWSNKAAISLYESLGFQRYKTLPKYYIINGIAESAYLYVLYINGGEPPPSALEMIMRGVQYLCESQPISAIQSISLRSFDTICWLIHSLFILPFRRFTYKIWQKIHGDSDNYHHHVTWS